MRASSNPRTTRFFPTFILFLIPTILSMAGFLYGDQESNYWGPWEPSHSEASNGSIESRKPEISSDAGEITTPKLVFQAVIKFYQVFISPAIPSRCNFNPSCSQYAFLAVDRCGILQGSVMAAERLMRDHPGITGLYYYNPRLKHFEDRVEDNIYFRNLFVLFPI